VAGEDRALEPELVHHRDDVLGHRGGVVAAGRLAGVAVAARGDRVRVHRARQRGEHGLVGAVGVGEAVQQDDRDAVRVALLEVGDQQAVADLDGLRCGDRVHVRPDASPEALFRQCADPHANEPALISRPGR
jgi:hypothetical protein